LLVQLLVPWLLMLIAMVQVLALTPTHQAVPCRWDLECWPVSPAPPASGDGASPHSVTCGLRDPVHAFGAGHFTDSAVPHASGFGSRASHDGVVPLSYTAWFGPSAPRIH
jgi:hypothetical protein